MGGARGAALLVDGLMVRKASVTLAFYSSLPWVARSAAHVALPDWMMVREASMTLALYSSLP